MKTILSPSTPFQQSSTQLIELGAKYAQDSTGRVWHYCQAGAATLARGKYNVSATQDAQRVNLSFSVAPAIGDYIVSVTIGTGAATANDYKDGWLVVQDGTGEGRAYPIEGHDAITASTAGKFLLKEPIDTAGALSETNVDLIKNLYDDIVISVADQADSPVGVCNVALTATYYGWVQTYGACSVLMEETIAAGAAIAPGETTVGSVQTNDGAGEAVLGIMGPHAGVDTEYTLVYLRLEN
jgi:hypothetical protein